MRHLKIGLLATAAIAVVATGVIFFYKGKALVGDTAGAATPPHMMAMPVPVTNVVKKDIPIYLEFSARTEAIRNITLQAKIQGYILRQNVPDGTDVKEGDLLYTIDPRDSQAALDQAKAQVQRDKAALDYARVNLDRGTSLAQSGYLAKDTYDQRSSVLRQAEAALAMNEAAARTAELNLAYTEIRAPFSGRLGRNQASVGTWINVGGTPLNTLVQLDPIYVTFNPSETDLPELVKARAAGKVVAEVLLPGETQARYSGELTFLDNTVDRLTGTILARATIANMDLSLLPGQYVRVRLSVREQPNALLVPQTAIGSSQLGKYVYIVGDGNKAEQKLVTLGATDHELVVVNNGISDKDQIISGNLQKIGPGAPVQPLPPK
jgi:membrane fusion protein, multidrug efflux system